MIEVNIRKDGIFLKGHAYCKERDGIDRACTAVSVLTCNLINSLADLTEDKIDAVTESGLAKIKWDGLSDKGKLLVDSWVLGLTDINREYNCIKFV